MGELLCSSRGGISSSPPACSCRMPCRPIFHTWHSGGREPTVEESFSGRDAWRSRSRTSFARIRQFGRVYRDLTWAGGTHGKECAPLCDRVETYGAQFSSKVSRQLAKELIVRASTTSVLGCDACGWSSGRFGNLSSLAAPKKEIDTESVVRIPIFPPTVRSSCNESASHICSHFHAYAGVNADLQPELRFNTRPVILRSSLKKAEIPIRLNLPGIHSSRVGTREVTVHSKPRPWWKQVLFQQLNEEDYDDDPEDNGEDGDGSEEGDYVESNIKLEDPQDEDDIDNLISDDRRYFSWEQKKRALDELREYQESGRDPENKDWEDWLDDSWGDYTQYLNRKEDDWFPDEPDWEKGGLPRQPPKMPERGMNRTIKELLLRIFDAQEEVEDDLRFEEKVFRFTSRSTARFVTILILVPWLIDIAMHDFVVVPFLRRWVEEVPLAAKILDLKESQKLYMVDRLKMERQRVRFESEIGKAPPLSEMELNEHIRQQALELREEFREENRQTFGNLWSDAVAGFTVFLLLICNPQQVSIMQMTGDRIFTNISDTGKAFIIILCTDIFLGYHSETGWETVIDILLDHYGLEASQGSIYIFVAIVPVTIDACFKLWVFRYLSKLSPSAAATFREMKRH